MSEQAFTFACMGDELLGIIHTPDTEAPSPIGLLILVGGPQYRVGAHRQYLHLARTAAENGIAAMRFDYRGVGDSSGVYPGFENVGPDIDAAIIAFKERVPSLQSVVLWGMCEGASAILINGVTSPDVAGITLANPWVRTETAEAQTYLKHYYGARFLSLETWKRVIKGEINLLKSLGSILGFLKKSRNTPLSQKAFTERMSEGLERYSGHCLLLMSEHDLVAREFDDSIKSGSWNKLLNKDITSRVDLLGSDHTFSSEIYRQKAAAATVAFIHTLSREKV